MFYQTIKEYIKEKTEQVYARNEIIYHEGDNPEKLYFLESGMVGLFHVSKSGKETFFRVFAKGDILGHRSHFADEPYHASTMALTPVKIVMIRKEECQRICRENPEFLLEITSNMARDLGKAELRMAGLLDKTAHKRISETLVYLKLKYPDYVWTRKQIAEYSGSTFETVARVMTNLEKRNLIEKLGRDFKILDLEQLLALSEQDLQ